jgi:glycosyltransferase involved in cell wall biosynthesis
MPQTISVIIPTYNYGRFIEDAIRSVLDQTHPVSEIIVVDDGSTDETRAVVERIGRGVKYIYQPNRGVCAARNYGVGESSGEVIAFLDADDVWGPTKLEKQILRLDTDAEIGLVHCGIREFEDKTNRTIRLFVEGVEDGAAESLLLFEPPLVNVSGSVIMTTRKAFELVSGFDTRMKVSEDWDFCYRVARRFKVAFVAEPLVNYRVHGAAAHLNVENMEQGLLMFYEKAFTDPTVARWRRHAYGNFHKVMAGSYYHSGRIGKSLSHAARSIWLRPTNAAYFFGYPARRLATGRAPENVHHS